MAVIVLAVIVVGLVYKHISKRRAQKRAAKLASLRRAVSSPVDARVETLPYSDDVMVIETRRVVETRRVETRRVVERESMPPPYSMPTPPPDDSDSELEYSGTYAYVTRDKPPSYSSTIRRVQNQ